MKIPTFIEKAIEGGSDLHGHYRNTEKLGYPSWRYEDGYVLLRQVVIGFGGDPTRHEWKISIAEILLDPEAWKAVGKVEGWPHMVDTPMKKMRGYEFYMHRLIDHLAEGGTIESYLETL